MKIFNSYSVLWISLQLLLFYTAGTGTVRIYPHKLDPTENPDYQRYAVPHPTYDVFGTLPQFATLRSIYVNHSELTNYTQLIDKFCLNPNTTLGHILWPRDPAFLFADNHKGFIDYVKSKGLYVTSVHGFSPVVAGFRPPNDVLAYLEETLGSKWLGMANGEQDGHYFGAFVVQELPRNNDPVKQYLNFRRYFDGMEDILGPRLTTLLSGTFPHYQLKTGLYTLAGAETSQHGPNAQIRYAFIRGAGKQYGVLWFGNVSIFNRFGHKVYTELPNGVTSTEQLSPSKPEHNSISKGKPHGNKRFSKSQTDYICSNETSIRGYGVDDLGDPFGPTCGTSLNLMKRLMYAQMMYNSVYASFEDGWFTDHNKGNTLSPIGLIQHNAYKWTNTISTLGTYVPTIALYLDFFNGWTTPRDLKRGAMYHTWGNLPYTTGDYLTDGILRMIYPHYQDASYFHDETGASSSTPYGDGLDVLLSDSPSWVLMQYDTVIISSELRGSSAEVEHNLNEYVKNGGHLVLTAGNLQKFKQGEVNVSASTDCKLIQAGAKFLVTVNNKEEGVETYSMAVCPLKFQPWVKYTVLVQLEDSTPLIVLIPSTNGGSLIILATPFAISSSEVTKPTNDIDASLLSPYPLLDHARYIFDKVLKNASLFTSSSNLSLVPTFVKDGEFLVLVSNPQLKQQPLDIKMANGEIINIEEVKLDQSEKGAVGYLPDGFENTDIGKSTNSTIAGGDTRLFRVTVKPSSVSLLPKTQPKPRPRGIALHLRHIGLSIQEEILVRPSFFQHYDSVVVDYAYLITKDDVFLKEEKEWLTQQQVAVYVDASPSINLFPTLRLTKDASDLYNRTIASMKSLIQKMYALGSQNLIISLHTFPGDESKQKIADDINSTVHYLNDLGTQHNITLHMLDTLKNPYSLMPMSRWLAEHNLSSIQLVLNLARLVNYGYDYKYDTIINTTSSLLYISAPGWDAYGTNYADNVPIAAANATGREQISKMLNHICSLRNCPYSTNGTTEREYSMSSGVHRNEPLAYVNEIGGTKWIGRKQEQTGATFYPFVMDAVYTNEDEEFNDVNIIETLLYQN